MILDAGPARLSYFVAGEGPPVTLLHGFTQRGESWREVISKMPGGRRFIVPDLRGHGDTRLARGERCSMEGCAADLEAMWRHLGVDRTHLAGYSMGGRLALHTAAHAPHRVASLLTLGAHAGLDEGERETRRRDDDALAERIEREGVASFVEHWSGLPLFSGLSRRGGPYIDAQRAQRLGNDAAGLACSLRGMGAGAMLPVWDLLRDVSAPCTFVAGSLDERFVAFARRLAGAVPHGRVAFVEGAGHPAHQEDPDAFVEILERHLAAAAASGGSSSTRA